MSPQSTLQAEEPPSIWAMVTVALMATFGAAIAQPSGPPATPSGIPALFAVALYLVVTSTIFQDFVLRRVPVFSAFM